MSKPNEIHLTGGPLLNFYGRVFAAPHPVIGTLTQYKTVEHYFQAHKGLYLKDYTRAHAVFYSVQEIIDATRPHDAKRMGRALNIWLPLWNRSAFGHMLQGQLWKFSQHADLAKELLDTGSKKLIEHRPDPVWGDNMDGTGKNLCGRSLMMIRRMARDWDLDAASR